MSKLKKQKMPYPVEAYIDSLSHDGRGIARINGKTVFIDGALPDEQVKIKYISVKSRFDEAVTTEVVTPSEKRVIPECKYFKICGGCSLQHMHSQYQVDHKQSVLIEQLNYIGKVKPLEIFSPILSKVWSYRHKAKFGVKKDFKNNKILVGFREKGKSTLVDIDDCKVLHPDIRNAISSLKTLISKLSIKSHISQIDVAIGDDSGAIVLRHSLYPDQDDISLLDQFSSDYQLNILLQSEIDQTLNTLSKKHNQPLSYNISEFGVKINFSPVDFTQINFEMNEKMISKVIELLVLSRSDKVLDLFCGLGNFTLPIALNVDSVTGIEGSSIHVQRAKENAELNNIYNTKFYNVNLYAEKMRHNFSEIQFNKILLNPPRKGAREIIGSINFHKIEKVVYVSCNPATLARDAQILVHDKGYTLVKTGVIDMFPQTEHFESVAVFEKN
ncbi:MAG: 23S rRNA (uracil(1939)-C(5))-methyltransferase RlmD [Gammaproteobacteria bacterium]|jgi:23S rRNA (uracil1939-C5)-methyltransferase